jgi:hypothetical protein
MKGELMVGCFYGTLPTIPDLFHFPHDDTFSEDELDWIADEPIQPPENV